MRRTPHDRAVARIDGAAYARGARLATSGAPVPGRLRRVAFALRHAALVPSYLRLLLTLPVVALPLSSEPAGAYLREHLASSWRRSGSHALLRLPASRADYLRGRNRHALRTNLHHAAALGLFCAPIPTSQRTQVLGAFARAGSLGDDPRLGDDMAAPFTRWWSVTDGSGHTQGIGYVVADGSTALLRALIGPDDRSLAHQTRFLLHTTIVEDLIADGTQFLLLEAMMGAPAGHKYFAARLGYQACRVRCVAAPQPRTAGAYVAAAGYLATSAHRGDAA